MAESDKDDWVGDFERECAAAGVTPEEAIRAAGLHMTSWYRWRAKTVEPLFATYRQARRGIALAADLKAKARSPAA